LLIWITHLIENKKLQVGSNKLNRLSVYRQIKNVSV
jgi:hypothetical protein